jgi:hypothetical protein
MHRGCTQVHENVLLLRFVRVGVGIGIGLGFDSDADSTPEVYRDLVVLSEQMAVKRAPCLHAALLIIEDGTKNDGEGSICLCPPVQTAMRTIPAG